MSAAQWSRHSCLQFAPLRYNCRAPLPHSHGSVILCILSRARKQAVSGLFMLQAENSYFGVKLKFDK